MKIYEKPMHDADFEKLITPAPFSEGQSRTVYYVPSDPDVVVKRVKNEFPGPNIIEWQIWGAIQETDLVDLFGRCITISWSGRYLMMERLDNTEAEDKGKFPKIPDWLTDRKPSAFGKDKAGTIKVRDYGTLKLRYILENDVRVPIPY